MSKKVKIPKEVAKEIEEIRLRLSKQADHYLLSLAFRFEHGNYGYSLFEFAKENFDVYVQALVNGYVIEYTPEELVRLYHDGLKEAEDICESKGASGSQFRQGWQSVEETLRLLGIKVKGVNA